MNTPESESRETQHDTVGEPPLWPFSLFMGRGALFIPDLPPSKPILYFAIGLLAAFFLPWFQLLGTSVSGYQIGSLGSYGNYAWIIPILAGSTITVSLLGKSNRDIGTYTGLVPIVALLCAFVRITREGGMAGSEQIIFQVAGHVFSIGAYLTLICSICLLVLGLSRPSVLASATDIAEQPRPSDTLTQLERLASLRAQGMLSDAEFEAQKKRILQ